MIFQILKISELNAATDLTIPTGIIIDSKNEHSNLIDTLKVYSQNGTLRAIGIIETACFRNEDIEYFASCGVFVFICTSIESCCGLIKEYLEANDCLAYCNKALFKEDFIHAIASGNPS